MDEDELVHKYWDDDSILYEETPTSNSLAGQTEIYEPPPSHVKKCSSHQLVTVDKLPEAPQNASESSSILYEHFGFVPPQLHSKPPPAAGIAEGFKLIKVLGLTYIDEKYWQSSASFFASEFLRSLESKDHTLPAELWDLGMGNRLSLGSSKRLKYLRRFGPLFIFDFGTAATCRWILAVEKASIALWLCRLDDIMDEQQLSLEMS